ncbi:MAG: TetR/AcrR family transcriptional regulator [Bacillota bacterium]
MPTDTFFNLPEEKKKRIIDAALDEFSEHSYHQARVSKIVNKAEIPKGSFYQYFNNKKEIFIYIIDIMGEKKLKYLEDIIVKQPEMEFFEFLEKLYKNGLKFAKDHPRLNKIGNKLFSDANSELFEEIMAINKNKSIEFFRKLLQEGVEKNKIDSEVNIKLTAYLLTNINIFIGELVYKESDIEMEDMEIVNNILYLIKNGLKKK